MNKTTTKKKIIKTTNVRCRGEHRTRFFDLSCFLPSSWRASGQDKNQKCVLSYRTGQDRTEQNIRTPGPPVLYSALMSIFCPSLSCFLPWSWWAARQDKNKKRVLFYRTGQDTRTACPALSSGPMHVS